MSDLFLNMGIVLAAGASSRMGVPKALLQLDNGMHLARAQAELLLAGGCTEVITVLGSESERVQSALVGVATTINHDWKRGRLSSLQAGIKALKACDGMVILPVDTVGVRADTIRALLAFAERENPPAVRPVCDSKEGHLAWISEELAMEILERDSGEGDVRLDDMLRPLAIHLPVDDPAILANVNTPEEWTAVCEGAKSFAPAAQHHGQ